MTALIEIVGSMIETQGWINQANKDEANYSAPRIPIDD